MKWKKITQRLGNITTTLLFVLIILIGFSIVSSSIMGREPSILGYQLKMVLSGSMEPEIHTGSVIVIKLSEDGTSFKEGDVVTYRTKGGIPITHRIVEVKEEGESYVTKGDNNDGVDLEPALAQNIIGKYTGFMIPYIGYAVHFAQSQQGILLTMILPGILLIIYSIVIMWQIF